MNIVQFVTMSNIFVTFLLLLPLLAHSQTDLIADPQDDDPDEINISKIYEHFRADPLDINRATRAELSEFYFLAESIIDTLLQLRPFYNKNQIKGIIGDQVFDILEPFIQIASHTDLNFTVSSQITRKFDRNDTSFTGSMMAMTNSLRLRLGDNISAGILIQKDAGETSLSDHWSGNTSWTGFQKKVTLIAGDFRLHVGQGLITSSVYSNMKSTDVSASFRRHSSDGKAALSSDENNTHRGLYLCIHPCSWFSGDLFYSHTLHDANNERITGISASGYHRTVREKKLKNLLKLRAIGVKTEFIFSNTFSAGFILINSKYDPSIMQRINQDKRRTFFDYWGDAVLNYSSYFNAAFDKISLSGEIALRDQNLPSVQISCLIKEKPLKIGFKFWQLPPDYYAPFSKHSEQLKNSSGFLLALSQRPSRFVQVDSYTYGEKTLWRTYFNPLTVVNKEHAVSIKILFSDKSECNLIYKYKIQQNYSGNLPNRILFEQRSIRFDYEKPFYKSLRLRIRLDVKLVNKNTSSETGTNFFHDVRWLASDYLMFLFRYSSYYSPSYDARVYEFENDLPYIFASRSLFGKGVKWYLFIRWNYLKKLELQIKFHVNRQFIDDHRSGHTDTDHEGGIFLQYRW